MSIQALKIDDIVRPKKGIIKSNYNTISKITALKIIRFGTSYSGRYADCTVLSGKFSTETTNQKYSTAGINQSRNSIRIFTKAVERIKLTNYDIF